MQRLFAALRLPAHIRQYLLSLMGGISGARWQTDEQLHLTLRFIGEVDRHAARDILAALSGIRHPRFAIALAGLGTFERRGQAETVWVGVSPHEPLKMLHNKIDQAIVKVGIPAEQRAYLPHITLARLKRSSGPVRDLIEQSGGLSSPPFEARHFSLFESRLTSDGAVYGELQRFPLS